MTRFRLFYLGVITVALTVGCNTSQNMTGSTKYEDDEVYYRKGEHFITEASNSSSAQADSQNSVNNNTSEEDYYSGGNSDGGTVNNYYGDVIQNNDSYGNGISNRYARFVFDPYIGGWRIGYGYSSAWTTWNSPYYNSWYFGYMDPWISNNYGYWGCGWGSWRPNFYYNNYYMGAGMYYANYGFSPYSPYNVIWNQPGWGGYGNYYYTGHDSGSSIVFGHRPSFGVNSNFNSSYTNGTLNTHRKTDAVPATNPTRPGDNTSSVNGAPSGGKTGGNGTAGGSDHNSGNNSTKPNRDSGNNRPSENPNVDRGSRGGNSSPNVNPSRGGGNINRGNGGSSPSRNGGTSPSRGSGGSSPSRGSGGGSAPSRSGGGGRR
ncbi:MAG: hypothetical protein R2809_11330 [Flavobacteriales bacterium]